MSLLLLILLVYNIYKKLIFYILEIEEARENSEAIYNGQEVIVLATANGELQKINSIFFETFGFKDMNDFKERYKCICDLFNEKEELGYLKAKMGTKDWVEYVLKSGSKVNKVSMTDKSGKEKIYEVRTRKEASIPRKEYYEQIIVFTDITLLTKQHKELQKSEKLRMLGEIVGMIAHQWRQPLNTLSAILSKLDLKSQMGLLEKEDMVASIVKQKVVIKNLSGTIDDFLSFFNDNITIETRKMKDIVNQPLKILEALIVKNNIIFEIIAEEGSVRIKNSRLDQVLVNLYKNAIDELVEKEIESPKVKVTIKTDKQSLFIMVEDNGGGIPEKLIGKIFEPYFSTKSKNGTGLGLYMSSKIIEEQLEGVLIASNEKEGAVFTISLPLIF